ncbi:glycosyltransferase family 2 protein [Halosimplex sp. J119]
MRSSKPLVSVVLPVLNDRDYIERCIDSILSQSYDYIELIIVDGGSTDGTLEYCKEIAGEQVQVLHGGGFVASCNKGVKMSEGEFIARVDADVISKPTRFEKQVKVLQSDAAIAAVGSHAKRIHPASGTEWIDKKPVTDDNIRRKLIFSPPIIHPASMIRKSHLLSAGGYRDYHWEDYELWTRLQEHKIINIDDVLVEVYNREGSIQGMTNPITQAYANIVCGYLAIKRGNRNLIEKMWMHPSNILYGVAKGVRSMMMDRRSVLGEEYE